MRARDHAPDLLRRHFVGFLALLPFTLSAPTAHASTGAPEIPDVGLLDSGGAPYRFPELLNHGPVIISFFFTRCTTLCPMQTALMRNLQAHMQRRQSPGLLLSISLDPTSDTPAALTAYATKFKAQVGISRQWLLLTGDEQALSRVWRAFDSATGKPQDHASTLWIGSAARHRWARQFGLPGVQQLMAAMQAVNA